MESVGEREPGDDEETRDPDETGGVPVLVLAEHGGSGLDGGASYEHPAPQDEDALDDAPRRRSRATRRGRAD